MSVIVLLLAVAVPSLSAMNADARLRNTKQTIDNALTRAYYLSVAERCMTAVRFMPTQWTDDADSDANATGATGQQIVIYRYTSTDSADPNNPELVRYAEFFQRAAGIGTLELPEGVWVAPVEALSNQQVTYYDNGVSEPYNLDELMLTGNIGEFYYNPVPHDTNGGDWNALVADDFLIVFDPETGLVRGAPEPYRIKAYSPIEKFETHAENPSLPDTQQVPFQRYGCAGVIVYQREQFEALGTSANYEDRQSLLRREGAAFLAQPNGGGLREVPTPPEDN